ncbi:hypothetical protein QTI24_29675 [Variovorax sp. J22P240]|uniref:hypothetical protein n=1 Tax=Variovorax sp. J22P240 TaxID=3053514 RepID=UPI0025759A86|nr:hypothetical protein [Variovorax sp. J22P240]MDM0002796.1 hypothetical protein [Variovorax sp. J22P240]
MDWVLVLTFHLLGPQGEIRDIGPNILPGFATEATCSSAANSIAESLLRLEGKARERQGIARNSDKSIPAVNYECFQNWR